MFGRRKRRLPGGGSPRHRANPRRATALLCLAILLGPAGCTHTRTIHETPKPVSLGNVGIVAARDPPDVRLSTKPKGVAKAALSGFGEGLVAGVLWYCAALIGSAGTACIGADCSGESLLYGGAAAAGIGGVAGSIWSMAVRTRDVPPFQKKRIEGAADEALSAFLPSEELREATLEASSGLPGCRAVALRDESRAFPGDPARYRSFSEKGIDTVLEIDVSSMGLEGTKGGRKPNLVFFMRTRLRLVRAGDGFELGTHVANYRGDELPFLAWSTQTGSMVEQEYDLAVRRMGERVAKEFLCPPPVSDTSSSRDRR